jgi:hypothetical protein
MDLSAKSKQFHVALRNIGCSALQFRLLLRFLAHNRCPRVNAFHHNTPFNSWLSLGPPFPSKMRAILSRAWSRNTTFGAMTPRYWCLPQLKWFGNGCVTENSAPLPFSSHPAGTTWAISAQTCPTTLLDRLYRSQTTRMHLRRQAG